MRRALLPLFLALTLCAPAQAGELRIPKDKALHFGVGAAISLAVTAAARAEGRKFHELWGIGASFLVGLMKELADRREPGNKFDGGDLAATVAGGVFVSVSFRW